MPSKNFFRVGAGERQRRVHRRRVLRLFDRTSRVERLFGLGVQVLPHLTATAGRLVHDATRRSRRLGRVGQLQIASTRRAGAPPAGTCTRPCDATTPSQVRPGEPAAGGGVVAMALPRSGRPGAPSPRCRGPRPPYQSALRPPHAVASGHRPERQISGYAKNGNAYAAPRRPDHSRDAVCAHLRLTLVVAALHKDEAGPPDAGSLCGPALDLSINLYARDGWSKTRPWS